MKKNLIEEINWIKSGIKAHINSSDRIVPGQTWLLDNRFVLSIPTDQEIRYPLGSNGYNFWFYSSGMMHSNEGLFSPILKSVEGMEEKVGFYAGFPGENENFDLVSLLPNREFANNIEIDRYVVFSPHSVYYITETPLMSFYLRIFLNRENKTFFTLYSENKTDITLTPFIATYFNPYLRHSISEGAEDKWFRQSREITRTGNSEESYSSFLIETNEDISRTVSNTNYGIINRSISSASGLSIINEYKTTSRKQFLNGAYTIDSSKSLNSGNFGTKEKHLTTFTEIGIASEINHFSIDPGSYLRQDISFNFTKHNHQKDILLSHFLKPADIDQNLIDVRINETEESNRLKLETVLRDDYPIRKHIFTPFFEHLKKQVEFCSLLKGYVQLSENSLIGIRDIFQALEAFLYWNPSKAKEKILEALNYIFIDGRCPRQYTVPDNKSEKPVMDIRPFIDQGVWVISTIVHYIKVTGDRSILDEQCGYYILKDEFSWEKSEISESVLKHIFRILEYLIKNRCSETGCSLALYGDWNDALDGLGVTTEPDKEYGTGVSVMTTLQLYQNLSEVIELLNCCFPFDYRNELIRYHKIRTEIEEGLLKHSVVVSGRGECKILHGWGDRQSYSIGSFSDPDNKSRDGLTSNAFWILSGLINKIPELKDTILSAFERLDSKYGFKTFNPGFPTDMEGVGRIKKLPIGTAENGAVYVHASTFGVMALFKVGEAEKAWKQLIKLLPFNHDSVSCTPFVIPNSYGENSELNIDGESMLDWQTGSSNVIFKTLLRYALGIEAEHNGIWIQPASWQPFKRFSLKLIIQGSELQIKYRNSGNSFRKYKINGKEAESIYDTTLRTNKVWIESRQLKEKRYIIDIED